MAYEVKTAVFEGPLDLLLQLISRHQLDVTQVDLTAVLDDYLTVVDEMRSTDLEGMSEFVLIAATLMRLKARSLLPEDEDSDLWEELASLSHRDLLLTRLLAGMTFKDVAAVLVHRMREATRYVPRRVGFDRVFNTPEPPVQLQVNAADLARIAGRVFSDSERTVEVDHLDLDLPSVDDAIEDLRRRITGQAEASFSDLVDHCRSPVDVIAYFLALLELARWGALRVSQENPISDIRVRRGEMTPGVIPESEWSR